MDATAWTVVGAAVAILVAVATSFRSLRAEMRTGSRESREEIGQLRARIDAQGNELRERIDAQGKGMSEEIGQLRERMARLEGLLSGLREAITANRAA